MEQKLGVKQHKAWAYLITRQAKLITQIEKDLLRVPGILPLHLYDVLLSLKNSNAGRLRFTDIANEIVTSKSALSRSIEKLEALQMITREKAEDDGRGQFAIITKKGLSALALTWPYYENAIHKYFGSKLTSKEADLLVQILKKFDF